MNLDDLLAVVDKLPPNELERLKNHLAERQVTKDVPRSAEEWQIKVYAILDEFWGDSSEQEIIELLDAIRLKNPSSDKGL